MWVGGLADSQTRSKPPKSSFLTEISPFVFPNLTKTLGWVGKQIWDFGRYTKKSFFWAGFPILHCGKVVLCHLGRLRSSWFFLWNLVAELFSDELLQSSGISVNKQN